MTDPEKTEEAARSVVPPHYYDRKYFLSDNDGYREFLDGLDLRVHEKFRRVLRHCDIKRGDCVLDIGCGRGELLYYSAKRGARALGIDYSNDAVKLAQEAVSRLPAECRSLVTVTCAQAEEYQYEERFDYIFMSEVLEHMHDWQLRKLLAKLDSILKDDGIFVVTTPNYLYESFLQPLKMALEAPLRFLKFTGRVVRGKYHPASLRQFLADAWKTRVDRGKQARDMHCNVCTVSKVRGLFRDFDARVYCSDPSLHPLSLLLAPWCGRQITAVVRKRKTTGHP